MDKIPFGVYDFFAYLSSGTVIMVALDHIAKTGILKQPHTTPVIAVVLVIGAYVMGHVVAHFSSFLLEQLLIGRVLRRPTGLLMGEPPRFKALTYIFPNYYRALPEATRARVYEQTKLRRFSGHGDGLFLHAYALVTRNDKLQARLDEFRNQYGFARNMSFALITSAALISVNHLLGDSLQWGFITLAFGAGIALLYRYLKFFRQYSYELLLRYAELHSDNQNPKENDKDAGNPFPKRLGRRLFNH